MNKLITSILLGASLVAFGACSEKTSAQEDRSHADHKHDAAPDVSAAAMALDIPSGNYTMDMTHGYVTFSYLHKGLSRPQLRFNDVEAHLVLDGAVPENSKITVTIKAANIDSGVVKFDQHLNGPDFFDVAANPEITFVTTGFTRTDAGSGVMHGTLTMMGVTRPIDFDVSLIGTSSGKKPALGVQGSAKLKRSDFGLGKYVPHVGDEVSIAISAEFYKDD